MAKKVIKQKEEIEQEEIKIEVKQKVKNPEPIKGVRIWMH